MATASTNINADRQRSMLVDNHENYRRSAGLDQLMFYQGGGSWCKYPEEMVDDVARSTFSKRIPAVEVIVSGRHILLDFFQMIEVDFATGCQNSIAWCDSNGRLAFPKYLVKNSVYEINGNDEEEATSKQRRPESDDSFEVGPTRTVAVPVSRWAGATALAPGVDEYKRTRGLFLWGLSTAARSGVTITGVHAVKNGQRDASLDRLIRAVRRSRGEANDKWAWYGTSGAGVERILARGTISPADLTRCIHSGVGAYLAPLSRPKYSTVFSERDENGEKHVLLCRVVLGKSELARDCSQVFPSTVDFDTAVSEVANPKWHVIWPADMNTIIFPQFVLSYRAETDIIRNTYLGTRFSVPSAKFGEYAIVVSTISKDLTAAAPRRELHFLFRTWMNWNISEDVFLQHLRNFVSVEKLQSMIDEIRRG